MTKFLVVFQWNLVSFDIFYELLLFSPSRVPLIETFLNPKWDWFNYKWLQIFAFYPYIYDLINTQSIKFWWRALNQKTFHNLHSYFACWHIKICKLIKHKICKYLVKINKFRPVQTLHTVWKYPKTQ